MKSDLSPRSGNDALWSFISDGHLSLLHNIDIRGDSRIAIVPTTTEVEPTARDYRTFPQTAFMSDLDVQLAGAFGELFPSYGYV